MYICIHVLLDKSLLYVYVLQELHDGKENAQSNESNAEKYLSSAPDVFNFGGHARSRLMSPSPWAAQSSGKTGRICGFSGFSIFVYCVRTNHCTKSEEAQIPMAGQSS